MVRAASYGTSHGDVGVPGDVRHVDPAQAVVLDLEVWPTGADALESEVGLQAGKPRAEAAVHAIAEGQRGAPAPL